MDDRLQSKSLKSRLTDHLPSHMSNERPLHHWQLTLSSRRIEGLLRVESVSLPKLKAVVRCTTPPSSANRRIADAEPGPAQCRQWPRSRQR
ncbi:hypothetical protein OKW28_000945 [Paraburkholderia sp. 40]